MVPIARRLEAISDRILATGGNMNRFFYKCAKVISKTTLLEGCTEIWYVYGNVKES